MKKALKYLLFLILFIGLGIVSCNNVTGSDDTEESNQNEPQQHEEESLTLVEAISRFLELDITDRGGTDAAVDIFLKLEPKEDEENSAGNSDEEEIELLGFSLDTSLQVTGTISGRGSGKVSKRDMVFTKYVDSISPDLREAAASGQQYGSAVLTLRKAGGDEQVEYMVITLENVIISSVSTGSTHHDLPTEQVSFTYQKIEWTWESD